MCMCLPQSYYPEITLEINVDNMELITRSANREEKRVDIIEKFSKRYKLEFIKIKNEKIYETTA